ncbi:tyrosine-type recombinase/integrase [Glaciecola sp. KUL10]|uniref:tyrosine-type recombinase/integrase n=1 Tax=Glaciecola sp. (strain KUL10) TaxID=2161813 RepID=UPI000D846C09|nr:tyrosine-type recombinase/integrase [Glaciecola sp. KUL10]GBL02964.1 Integrase [Glaciecola sp. KUL10]
MRRNKEDAWMPARVYRGKSAYEFHPKNGGAIRLCSLNAAKWEVLKAHEDQLNKLDSKNSLAALINEFFESADFADLAKTTQSDYQKYSRKIIAVFGKANPSQLKPPHIRKYMDKRGVKSKVQANREKTFLSRVYRWAYERGIVTSNPCQGVKQFKEVGRDKYIEDWEYEAVYKCAAKHIRVAMEISYLCAARKGDVLAMDWGQIGDEGIYIKQGKTNVKQIKLWTPRLRKAIAMAKELRDSNIISRWVICQTNGKNYTDNGFNAGWRKAILDARKETGMELAFTFHDIKAKSISDYEGSTKDKQNFSGHKTERQVATYDRKIKRVETLGVRKSVRKC